MSDKMRSAFEAWYCKKFTFENMARRTDGTYRGEHAFNSWISWQAALSQSEPVQVSQPVAFSNSTAYLYWQEGHRPTKDTLLYESPPDYEALKEKLESHIKVTYETRIENEALRQRVAELDRVLEGLPQDAIDGGWTAKGISQCLKNAESERDRLQSECDSLRGHLAGWKAMEEQSNEK